MPPASTVLPWPDPFPSFVGFQFFKGHDEEGNDIGGYSYWLEICGSTVKVSPSKEDGKEGRLLDMSVHVKCTLVKAPDSAAEDMQLAVGKFYLEELSGRVDLKSKTFHLTHAKLLEANLKETQYYLDESFQASLSADNNVLRCVMGDWCDGEDNDGFMFQSDGDVLDPDFCPNLSLQRGGGLEQRLHDAWDFLDDAKLYKEGQARMVEFSLRWQRLSKINTLETQFDARVFLELRWLLEKEDVYNYLLRPEGWQPKWSPTGVGVMNMASDGSASIQADSVKPRKIDSDSGVYAVRLMEISGSFFEDFELESFPADVQPLSIHLQVDGPASMKFKCIAHTMDPGSIHASEWTSFAAAQSYKHDVQPGSNSVIDSSNSVKHELAVTAYVSRRSFVFIVRIVVIMGLISGLSLSVFAMKPHEDFGDQLSNCFTLLLTAVAYSLVVASSLPVLGYLTFLDKYILASLCFICLVIAQVTALRCIAYEEPEELDTWNVWFILADAALLGCSMLVTGISYAYMRYSEHAKVPVDSDPKAQPNEAEPTPVRFVRVCPKSG